MRTGSIRHAVHQECNAFNAKLNKASWVLLDFSSRFIPREQIQFTRFRLIM